MELNNTEVKEIESLSACRVWGDTEKEELYVYRFGVAFFNKSRLLNGYHHHAFKGYLENEYHCNKMNHWVDLVILPLLGVIGIIGNICGMAAFSKKAKQTYYVLLLCLAVSDLITIISFILYYSFPHWIDHYTLLENPFYTYLILFAYGTLHVAQLIDIYLLIALSIERYLAICHPLRYRSRKISSMYYIIVIIILSFSISIPLVLEHYVMALPFEKIENKNGDQQFVKNVTLYVLKHTELKKRNTTYLIMNDIICKLFIKCIIPYILLLTTNILMVRTFCNLNQTPEKEEEEEAEEEENEHLNGPHESLAAQDSMRIHTSSRGIRMRQSQINLGFLNLSITVVFLLCYSLIWFWAVHDIIDHLHLVRRI